MNGTLYIVATPIGNLEDMTFRAVRVLKEADLIAAEDTRHTRKLLNHYGIETRVTSYFEHNRAVKGEFIVGKLKEGVNVALVSDAGTPGISDPGYELVKGAIEYGIRIVPIPGPCAAVTGLSISGLPTETFAFEGFLPPKSKARCERLLKLKAEERSLIFYESPQRVHSTLKDMHDTIGDRNIALLRELTKIHEEVLRGKISDVMRELNEKSVKGEIVIVMEGCREEPFEGSIRFELEKALNSGLSMKESVEAVSRGLGISKGNVYKEGLKIKGEGLTGDK